MDPLIAKLLAPDRYDHPVATVTLRETHISWILLAGDYAYKIKKPVDFGFLDFSSLEKRRFFCDQELRLNRRLAPTLYLERVAITGPVDSPKIGGAGEAIEYAVKMRRFPDDALFDALIEDGRLTSSHIDALADTVAAFHDSVARSTAQDAHGHPDDIHAAVMDNFEPLEKEPAPRDWHAKLDGLRNWCENRFNAVKNLLEKRKAEGFVRECHGDLHLGNIVLLEEGPTPFDCIEFNDKLRWVDVISEIAFTVMDLTARRRPDFAYRLLNRYLSGTGDYEGLSLMPYYLVYRSLVRAKIAMLSLAQGAGGRASLLNRCREYVDLAEAFSAPSTPSLILCHGFSGCGKSHLAARLSEALPAIWLRSDVERKRMAGLHPEERSGSAIEAGIYSRRMSEAVYRRLAAHASTLLQAGFSVIVDATFLKGWQRDLLRHAARACGIEPVILHLEVPEETLRARIRRRLGAAKDPSEADLRVLEAQLAGHDPLTAEELQSSVVIDYASEAGERDVVARLAEQLEAIRG